MGLFNKGKTMRKKIKFNLKSKYLLVIMTIVGISLIAMTFSTNVFSGPVKNTASYVVVPFQNGINVVGEWLTGLTDGFRNSQELAEKNRELQDKIDELTLQNQGLLENQAELLRLQELLQTGDDYAQYNKVGATIISKDPGNWYSTFVINKGTEEGLAVDMNVIAKGGLVGIITEVGDHWATVRSIIDDTSNVSGMIANTNDHCVVSGNLTLMNSDLIEFSQLVIDEGTVVEGDAVVTSNVSDKYQTGILIGYINDMEKDANNLTTSGTIIPSVDFKNLREVLVITDLKQAKGADSQ